jgi:lipid-binding SYLF domain-containing protein
MRTSNGLVALILILLVCGCRAPEGATISDKREAVQKMRAETLENLYKINPAAQEKIKNSAGYAVFSNIGTNLFLLSTGNGYGIARDNKTGADVFMRMRSVGVGVGLGVKDFRGVFVFADQAVLSKFTESGWEASGQADAAAKSGDAGGASAGAISVGPGVDLYQITEKGLALQATIQGTKYAKDDELNGQASK